jgi:hypothetical protein
VLKVDPDGAGGVRETEVPVSLLDGADHLEHGREESYAVSELRALRAGRHRWD